MNGTFLSRSDILTFARENISSGFFACFTSSSGNNSEIRIKRYWEILSKRLLETDSFSSPLRFVISRNFKGSKPKNLFIF
ncbi:MAG: hypothetical protein A3D74_01435 [Candidatus Levybacteria bacterium RIFCSPHIGHO2_02_FULL_37_13]|nr:MAG: hypothetical protein A3D74_01435 [Candidatus Levybacteria bacterium RIFCSPHIGHO2_02_FULL_37_13]OGH29927.1 MAG: hypothetical protein A3E40_04250 [Candidatus Levybacteria bacterium RIFCSPHIGHO2_12_FULL_37_9]